MDIKGLRDCRNLRHEAYILYEDAEDAETDSTRIEDNDNLQTDDYALVERGHDCREISENLVCSLDLKGMTETLRDEVDERLYIPFDVNTYPSFTDEMTDNRYHLYGFAYYPSYLSIKEGDLRVPQVNGVSFKYPSSPILSQPEDTPQDLICSLETRSKRCTDTPLFCECIQIFEVPWMKNIEIVLIDEGFGGNASHTFHLHGYKANIVGRESFGRPITMEEVARLDGTGKLPRNFRNTLLKDSFVVPNKGYVIFRFHADNLGYWLFEARSREVSQDAVGLGMQFLIKVGSLENSPPIPLDFPTCGNNKGPDLIFEMN